MHLTVEMLREAGACGRGIGEFSELFPRGVVVTVRAVRKAAQHGLDVLWAVRVGLISARLAVEAGLRPKSSYDALVWGLQLGPGYETRAAACWDPWAAVAYAQMVDRCARDDTRRAACGSPAAALEYAREVDRGPHPETRAAACRLPWAAVAYARDVDRGPHPETRAAAARDPYDAMAYAREVEARAK